MCATLCSFDLMKCDWLVIKIVICFLTSVFSLCISLGYEHYKTMRADPTLCFLSKVGLPNNMNDSTAGEPTDPDDRQVLLCLC